MKLISNTDGIMAWRQRLANTRAQVAPLLRQAAQDAGQWVAQNLSDAAPVGKAESGGTPIDGDAPGRLNESFYVKDEGSTESSASVSVRTWQPAKLKLVVEGRGEVLPKAKKALYWQGLPHPVRRAGPAAANDFVSPVLAEAPDAEEVLGAAVEQLAEILEG
jgi:hypothetical protein